MKKKLIIEVVGSVIEDIGNLSFNLYLDDEVVGYVHIDSNGSIVWDAINPKYMKDVLKLASKINGKKITNTMDEQIDCYTENPDRWIRAIHLIHV